MHDRQKGSLQGTVVTGYEILVAPDARSILTTFEFGSHKSCLKLDSFSKSQLLIYILRVFVYSVLATMNESRARPPSIFS